MATTIQIKRSSTASGVPLATDLAVGELAVNLADKRLFTKQSDGTIIELSTNPTDLDAATLRIDGVEITASATELNSLDGLTATTAELNTLDGITSTTAELNVLDGITATTAELNVLDGVTSTTAEINKLDGFTGTVADLNYAKDLRATGVTTAELDVLDGITATTAELNITDGLTATTAELNTLDGITATTTELNYTDGVTSNIQTQLNAMVEKAGDTMTGDLSLGDNVKAKFGTSDDLQIYHDGSNSRIVDTGTGNLKIQAQNFAVNNVTDTENMITAEPDGFVKLFYNGSEKLATTSTGVDVTGTITADGLDVRNTSSPARIKVQRDDNTNNADSASIDLLEGTGINADFGVLGSFGYRLEVDGATNKFNIKSGNGASVTKRLSIDRDLGDVSFYEDTGTTAKMVWDASVEGLNVGGNTNYGYAINAGDSGFGINSTSTAQLVMRGTEYRFQGVNASPMTFYTANSERMRIDSSGNVGIGRTNPSSYVTDDESLYVKGQIRVDGITNTASVPALAIDDTNSGIFSPAANTLGFSTAAAERMRIDSSGNVGIGTSSPIRPLSVQNTGTTVLAEFKNPSNTKSFISFANSASSADQVRLGSDSNSLVLSTNYTERARIDSSGKVGIGTDSPEKALHINSGATNIAAIFESDDASAKIELRDNTSTHGHNFIGVTGNDMSFTTGGSERARIDSSGNVGIGTASPSGELHVKSASANANLYLQRSIYTPWRFSAGSSYLAFNQDSSEKARIDSSGNLLVGKTSTSSTVKGVGIYNSGLLSATVDGDIVATLKRLNSDGEILRFRKDGTTVGSIGTVGGAAYFESNGTGFRLEDSNSFGNATLRPATTSGGSNDNAVDLGEQSIRWKDLYLSGGVYLGGTGSANKLDDYEEGTWDIHIKDSHDGSTKVSAPTQGRYTKIGNIVHLIAEVYANGIPSTTFVGYPYITLPFNVGSRGGAAATTQYLQGMGAVTCGFAPDNQSQLRLATDSENPLANIATGANIGGTVRFYASVTYRASA